MKEIEFLDACKYGDMTKFNALVDSVDINFQDEDGCSAIMEAANHNKIEIVKKLIEKQVNLEFKDEDEFTALMLASEAGFTDVVELLINGGANINHYTISSKWNSLMSAAQHGFTEIAKLFKGADLDLINIYGKSAYDIAFLNNHYPIMYELDNSIINGASGNTILMHACRCKLEENILFLYEKDVDFYFKNNQGESAIDILQNHDELPEKLQALMEMLVLEQSIAEEVDIKYSL